MIKYLLLVILLSGCSIHLGIGARANGNDYLNTLENPIGTIRLERKYDFLTGYCMHISSIPDMQDRPGTNFCGAEIEL